MIKLINERLKLLKAELKETKEDFEETDDSESYHHIDQLEFTIEQFETFKKTVKAELTCEECYFEDTED